MTAFAERKKRPTERWLDPLAIDTGLLGIGEPEHLQNIETFYVGCLLEPGALGRRVVAGLMEHDASWRVSVLDAVPLECRLKQLQSVFFAQVWLPILLGDGGRTSADDDAVASLVVDLGDGGVEVGVG